MDDDDIIQKTFSENWILLTNDKDFGDKIFRDKKPHRGAVLLRLDDERAVVKIEVLGRLLENYADKFCGGH